MGCNLSDLEVIFVMDGLQFEAPGHLGSMRKSSAIANMCTWILY